MSIKIAKIKLGNEPYLEYLRQLGVTVEHCKTLLIQPFEKITTAAQALLEDVIEIIGLDVDRWDEGKVIGLSLKWDGNDFGVTITAANKDEDGMCCNVNTPFIKEVGGLLLTKVDAVLDAAKEWVEMQPEPPEQLNLLDQPETTVTINGIPADLDKVERQVKQLTTTARRRK